MLTKTTHNFMAPKSMSSEKKNIELKSKEKITRTNCPASYKLLTFKPLQAPGQKSRTNSICPCSSFNLIILTFWSKATCFQPFCLKAEGVTPLIFLKNLVR